MMRNFKKVLAVVCSMTLVAGSSVTAFAEGPTSSAGTGDILAYSLESVIVPTSLKIALNPQEYSITKKAATVQAAATYEAFVYSEGADDDQKEAEFKENKGYLFTQTGAGTEGDPYVYAAADAFDKDETYYKEATPETSVAAAVTSAEQIVSFNYGIANFSTADKDINVSLSATGTVSTAAGKQAITFVDSIEKAQAYDETSNADGAKVDELKMYLAVVAAKTTPKLNDNDPFAITPVTGGKDITNITPKALADVSMTNADESAGAVAFAAGTGDTIAKADIAFKLGKAVYQIRDYDTLDWDTTQADLAKMTEIKTLGDITGFTFIGAMNPNVDWTTANVTALTFTPTYTISKITDTEEAVTGGWKQIKSAAAIAAEEAAEAEAAAEAAAQAAADAAAGFKTTHSAVLALDVDNLDGTEVEDIEAAITAFEALSDAAKEILAAEDTPITAETLNALKEAAEEAAEAAATPVSISGAYISANEQYDLTLPDGVTINSASDVTNLKVNGVAITDFAINQGKNKVRINRSVVKAALGGNEANGGDWATTTTFTFTFTHNGVNYEAANVAKNG